MVKRTLHLIRKNPIMIVPYAIFIGVNLGLAQFIARLEEMALKPEQMATAANKAMGIWILIMVVSVLFTSGYGSMIGAAVKHGKCRFKDFFLGIDCFLGRMMFYFVLFSFMAASFLLLIAVAVFPILLAGSVGGIKNVGLVSAFLTVGTGLLGSLIYPSVMLWFPAIFIEDTGVTEGLKKGFVASRKCYWNLVVTTFVSILPSVIYTIASMVMNGSAVANSSSGLTIGYIIDIAASVIVSFFIFIYIFVVYYTINSEKDT